MPELTTPAASTPGLTPANARPALSEEAELEQFVAAHGLRGDLERAVAIARESFPAGSSVTTRLWHSPEEDDTRAVVDVMFQSSPADASALYWKVLDRWTRELPPRVQGLITLAYSCG